MFKTIIEQYTPCNEQEIKDKEAMLTFIDKNSDALFRENTVAHFTSSAFIINKEKTKVLFAHHNIYNSWGWVGGHNDGDPDFLHVAVKEAKEETGVVNVEPYSNDIIGLDNIYVSNHIKHGKYVSDHIHMNVTYLLVASEEDLLQVKKDENSDVKWFNLEEALTIIDEPRMVPVYSKFLKYIKKLK